MKRELIGSAVGHAALFVLLILVSAPGAGLPPPIPPGDVMVVTPVDALPAGLLSAPEAKVPSPAEDAALEEQASVPIPEPEAIPVEPPKPKPKPEKPKPEKPKPKPQPEQPAEQAREPEQLAARPDDGVIESKVQTGSGSQRGGSLLGVQSGTAGGRPATYPDRVINKVYYTWRNPAKLPDTIRCSVVFRIDPDGQASQIALERTSGMPAFDNSAVRAVYEAAPYPPFPRSMVEQYIVMRIIFEYIP